MRTRLLAVLLICLGSFMVFARSGSIGHAGAPISYRADTVPLLQKSGMGRPAPPKRGETTANLPPAANTPGADTPKTSGDTLRSSIDTIRVSKDSLTTPVEYSATDSGVLIMTNNQLYLYGKASASQADVSLTANTIEYSSEGQMVKAYGDTDTSTSSLKNKPTIVQGGSTSVNDTIFFNLGSQKGLLKNSYYQEGEIFVNAERIKRASSNTAFAYRTVFTTCNLDEPHFAIRAKKVKLITGKLAVTGPARPEFEGVPVPVYLPFGIFPMNRGRSSGILAPSFAANNQFGLGLENGGYYKVINDYADVTVRGNLYSYGGFNFNVTPRYFKRYRYNGNLDFGFQNNRILNENFLPVAPGTPGADRANQEFIVNRGFQLSWNHTQDSKSRPGVTFGASVRAGSTRFNQFIPNNAIRNAQNLLSSTISYGRTWNDGKYNLTMAANHSQNSVDRLVTVGLPDATFSATTIYPFEKKEQVGEAKWYQKLGVSYNGTFRNAVSFYDTAISLRKLIDTAQWNATHSIPLTLALPALGPVIISPGINYSERWTGSTRESRWDPAQKRVVTNFRKGFFAQREITTSVNASTRIFGTLNFAPNRKVKAIRHEIKPSIGFSYSPDLNKRYYYLVQTDSLGTQQFINPLNGGNAGPTTGDNTIGGISFTLSNLLEMKVRDKTDTSGKADKKVRLLDAFDFGAGYNFLADSFKLSVISFTIRSTLFEKVNINGQATLDPYFYNEFGRRIDRFSAPRVTNASLSLSTSLTGGKEDDKKKANGATIPPDQFLSADEQMRQMDFVRNNPAEFVDFNIPWNLALSGSISYNQLFNPSLFRFTNVFTASANLNGDFSLTPKWKAGGQTFLDFRTMRIENLSLFITREMHCWQLAVNVNLGQFQSFSINISPKSGILRDLRINRSRFFFNQ